MRAKPPLTPVRSILRDLPVILAVGAMALLALGLIPI